MRFETAANMPAYMKNIEKYRLLTKEDEHELATRIQSLPADSPGYKDALDRLVVANLKFVVRLANTFIGQNVTIDDLINEGNLGLIEAAKRYDPATNKNSKFITYAQFWIRKKLNGAIANYSKIVKLPMNQEYAIYKAKKRGEEVKTHTIQLDRPIREGGEDTLGDVLLRSNPNDRYDCLHDEFHVRAIMEVLNLEERLVITARFGLDGEDARDNRELAVEMGLLPAQVAKIYKVARDKMRVKARTVEL